MTTHRKRIPEQGGRDLGWPRFDPLPGDRANFPIVSSSGLFSADTGGAAGASPRRRQHKHEIGEVHRAVVVPRRACLLGDESHEATARR
jgi:hypothetical protein